MPTKESEISPLRAWCFLIWLSIVRQMRGGRENDPNFGSRMSGTGNYAELMEKRFEIACKRFGLNGHGAGREPPELDCTRFRPPSPEGQLKLF